MMPWTRVGERKDGHAKSVSQPYFCLLQNKVVEVNKLAWPSQGNLVQPYDISDPC